MKCVSSIFVSFEYGFQTVHYRESNREDFFSSPTRNKSVMRDTNGEAHHLSEVDPYTLNGVNYTPRTVKYANLASLQDRKLSNSAPASPAKRYNMSGSVELLSRSTTTAFLGF